MSAERKRFDKKWKGRAYPEAIAEDVAKLEARIAALEKENAELRERDAKKEKCIEARDALMDHVKTSIPFYFQKCCKPYRDAIRRADEEAGR